MKQLTKLLVGVLLLAMLTSCNSQEQAPKAVEPQHSGPKVHITTNLGDIVLELYPDKAPKTVENFLQYVNDGFYDNTIFHRVIDGFMIQGGGFTAELWQKPTKAPVVNEAESASKAGLTSMRSRTTRSSWVCSARWRIRPVRSAGLKLRRA